MALYTLSYTPANTQIHKHAHTLPAGTDTRVEVHFVVHDTIHTPCTAWHKNLGEPALLESTVERYRCMSPTGAVRNASVCGTHLCPFDWKVMHMEPHTITHITKQWTLVYVCATKPRCCCSAWLDMGSWVIVASVSMASPSPEDVIALGKEC